MNAYAHRVPVAFGLVVVASLLAGCNGGSVSSTVPVTPAHLANTHAEANDVKIWAAVEQTNTVFGLSASGKRVLDVISTDTQKVKGGDPLTLKVDRANDVFVTDVSGGTAGVIQEYKDGKFQRAYQPVCAVSNCSSFTGSLADTVVDKKHVFAIMKLIQYKIGTYTHSATGYEYWPNGNPSATPVAVLFGNDCSDICDIDAGDEDSAGNLWVRDYGAGAYGIAEITNPTTNPTFNQILPFTFTIDSGDIAGFSISNAGTVLNVGDSSHNIYQYALPLAYDGSPFNTLTPCSQGCDPHGFGLNASGKLIVAGDGTASSGWLDLGQVAKNQWKKATNKRFTASFSTAVYAPSD